MIKQGWVLTILMFWATAYAADQCVFEQAATPTPPQSVLNSSIIINKTFANIQGVIAKLNTLGINASVEGANEDERHNILISSNGNVNDFISIAAAKFNYIVLADESTTIFKAKNPLKAAITLPPAIVSKLNQPASLQTWALAPTDKTLRNVLTKWTRLAGWQLIWNVNVDYPITTLWTISGTFESATNEVLKASQSTNVPLMATMHDSNHVLEIYSETAIKQEAK